LPQHLRVERNPQNNHEKYTFVLTEKEQNYRFALKNLKSTFASKKEKVQRATPHMITQAYFEDR